MKHLDENVAAVRQLNLLSRQTTQPAFNEAAEHGIRPWSYRPKTISSGQELCWLTAEPYGSRPPIWRIQS
ncbi:MAG: hypothetical protein K9G48_03405 [Reyranella sp.]|nr:hypothetical protein [Reyranella sp.]